MIYFRYRFNTRGVGIVSNSQIVKDTYIGNCASKFETITKENRIGTTGVARWKCTERVKKTFKKCLTVREFSPNL
jgi:hypothetical protein